MQSQEPSAPPKASLPVMVVNLVKSIIGAAVLSLASGTAAFSDSPQAVLPASVLVVLTAAICAYSFTLIARNCEQAGVTSFREAWSHYMGERSAWLVSVANAAIAGAGCLTYVIVLADSGTSLAMVAGLPPVLASRTTVMLSILTCLLLPLSFLESCSQLKFTSLFGICGVMYYIAAIAVRFAQGSYLPGGAWHDMIPTELRPSFDVVGGTIWSPKALVLISMLTSSYVCHYNAPKFWRELENRSVPRFFLLSCLGFGLSAVTYIIGLSCSFLTFGGASSGLIFNNYAATDGLFVAARALASFVILCTYPLLMVAFRDGVRELLPTRLAAPARRHLVTVALLAVLACLGLSIKDVGLVLSLPGAIFGSAVVYIFPALVFLRATQPTAGAALPPWRLRLERTFCRGLVMLGVVFASLGTASTLGLFG